MKKVFILSLIFAMSFSLVGSVALADTSVTTSLTSDVSGGAAPIVKAKWEANTDRYTDYSTEGGAQFMPSGIKDQNTTIAMCAIVTDPDGLADITTVPGAVYADVFYPVNIELGGSHTPLTDQSGLGCGKLMQEDSLTELDKQAGIDLFCISVRENNENLPTFNFGYGYDEICGEEGELWKDTAAVYCGEKTISYEDPSGDYIVWAVAQDKNGLQGTLENHFTYLPMTAFETDFNQIAYGSVRLGTHKIISGDKFWAPGVEGNKASVRNVGNTRLAMKIRQNDMGLGKTDGLWNVKYDARVGSSAVYADYFPEVTTQLVDELDLSELNEMDFSIDISKFPPATGPNYIGTMTLSAVLVAHLVCD
ncbi:MAG: hypothetical protein ABIJ91_00775 [Candidatus Kuenenbacteria bacterium]